MRHLAGLRIRRGVCAVAALSVLAGCASGSSTVGQERSIVSGLVGCIAGGAIAASVAAMTGKDPLLFGLGGCGAGAVVGLAAASYVNARTATYATEQERLQALSAAANADAEALEAEVAKLEQYVSDQKRQIAALRANVAAGRAKGSSLAARRTAVNEDVARMQRELDAIDARLALMEKDRQELAAQGAPVEALSASIVRIADARADLAALRGELKKSFA